MQENKEGLLDGACIEEAIRKRNIIMVCDGSYQPNLIGNRGDGFMGNPLYRHI